MRLLHELLVKSGPILVDDLLVLLSAFQVLGHCERRVFRVEQNGVSRLVRPVVDVVRTIR